MVRNSIRLFIFHDERFIPKKWLYHGFVLCKPEHLFALHDELIKAKAEVGCAQNKRIHFSTLSSDSNGSSRTRTAVKWAELSVRKLYEYIWFYLFGVNLSNIDYQFFGPTTNGQIRDSRMYNRFFEIGLFSACRYFFNVIDDKVEIVKMFSEERSLETDNPFLNYAPDKINQRQSNIIVKCKQIIQVAGDFSREKDNPECVEIVNFVDVMMGAFSQSIDSTGKQRGCLEVARKLFPVCRRLCENPYNKNSRYYKRYAMSFFPKKAQSKSRIISYGIQPPEEQFYPGRPLRLYQRKCLPGFEELVG
jgi:hypothetical protein